MVETKMKPLIKSIISQRLLGREGIKGYGEAVKNLSEKAKEIDESAVLFVALFEGGERYRELVKAIRNILNVEKIFNQRAIERNPEIAKEMAEAYEYLKQFNNVVNKRRKRIAMSIKKRKEQTLNNEQENIVQASDIPENHEDF